MNSGKLQAVTERSKLIKSPFVCCNFMNRSYDGTNEVGIISCTRDWYGCTYLTKDGGLTWEHIRNVHVPYDDITKIGYSRFYNFEKRDEKYILTAEIDLCSNLNENEQLDFSVYIFYESTDLINWNICTP